MMEIDNRPIGDHLEQKNHIVPALRRQVQAATATNDMKNTNTNNNNNNNNKKNSSSNNSNNNKIGKKNNIMHNNEGQQGTNTGRWSQDEHDRFLAGLDRFGTGNWKKITDMVGTRSCTQTRTHAQKYFIALQKPQQQTGNTTSNKFDSNSGHTNNNNKDDGYIYGTRAKKSKLLVGADHHIGATIRTGSSAIITGYGGGGTPIHLSGIVPVTSNIIGFGDCNNSISNSNSLQQQSASSSCQSSRQSSQPSSPALVSAPAPMMNRFWGPNSDGLRGMNTTGLTGMDVLAQAAVVENKKDIGSAASLGGIIEDHRTNPAYDELRKKIADEVNAVSQHQSHNDSSAIGNNIAAKTAVEEEEASSVVAKAMAQVEAQEAAAAAKRKRDTEHPGMVPSFHATTAQQFLQNQQKHKKLKFNTSSTPMSPAHTPAMQGTIDRKDVLEKLQAITERQEFLRLRQEVKNLNFMILQLQQQSIESDNRVMEAITDRRNAMNDCNHVQEINVQLKSELRRMVLLFEETAQTQQQQTKNKPIANDGPNNTDKTDNKKKSHESALAMEAAAQGVNADLMQAKLTESELRYHAVSESLSKQAGVLTDQHRAIVELNTQLEQERAIRQSVEFEFNQLSLALRQHHQLQQQKNLSR